MIQRFLSLLTLLTLLPLSGMAGENLLEIPDVETSPGVVTRVPVMLRNQDPVTAIELTIKADYNGWSPEMTRIDTTDRLTDTHNAGYNHNGSQFKLLIYSSDNSPLNASDGIVCYIPIRVDSYAEEGAEYPFEIIDCLLVRPDGENIATGYSAGNLVIRQTPDLRPGNVEFTPSSINPDDMMHVSWTVENIGSCATYAGFRETVELTDGTGRTAFLGERRYEDPIPAGASVNRESDFRVPSFPGMDGDLNVRVTLYPYSECGESVNGRDNNMAESSSTVYLANRLMLALPYEVTEGESEYSAYVMRAVAKDTPLSVNLAASPADSRLVLPQSVTIPAYENSVYFTIGTVADDIYHQNQDITVTASAQGFADTSATLILLEGAEPQFTLTESTDEITEGEKVGFTLTRNVKATEDIEVKIDCERTPLFRFPERVTFPAGATEIVFEAEAIDNTAISVPRQVLFQASAPGYASGSTVVTLLDNDMPEISLTLSPSTVAEDAGANGVLATVRRLSGSTDAIRLRITSSRCQDIFHDATIDLEAGAQEMTFPIGIVDNALVEGDREITLTAAIYSSDCGCWASEEQRGFVQAKFTLTDNDGPALSLTAPSTLSEGKEIQVTVKRNTTADVVMQVAITAEYDGQCDITFPASVTIPAGETSATFTVAAPANERENDSALVSLFASADGFSLGSCRIMVTDATLPDAVITSASASAEVCEPGSELDLTITVKNEGTAVLPAKLPVAIYLNGNQAATTYTMGSIAPGASETVVKSVTMPLATGQATLKVTVNGDRKVTELAYVNNDSHPVSVDVNADVVATLTFEKDRVMPGEPVNFSGKVTRGIKPGTELDIRFLNNGLNDAIRVATSADGTFSGSYTPHRGCYGAYQAGTAYPGDAAKEMHPAFDVVAISAGASFGKEEINEGESFSHTVRLSNGCSFPLTGLKAVLPDAMPEGILAVELPATMQPGEAVGLTIKSDILAATEGSDWLTLPVKVTSEEGAVFDYTLYYYAHSLRGTLNLSETSVSTTMTKGTERLYTVSLANTAQGETGAITVTLPQTSWLSLASPANIPSLKGGESCDITLRLTPSADMQLNHPVSATLAVNGENANGTSLTIKAEPVSETTGILLIEACDEYTYNTSEAPHVKGATVSVMHPATRKVLHTLTTDADGLASVEIPEGYYYVSVTEPSHSGYEGMLLVDPAKTTRKVVNLGIQGVSIDIRYEQTEVEDVYDIVTTVKYETNVPIPVVETVLPSEIDIETIRPGESILYNTVLTNKGLITAANTRVELPVYDDPEFTFSVIGDNGFDLMPGESRVVPVMVTRAAAETPDPAHAPVRRAAKGSSGSCHMTSFTVYESYCGPDKKIHNHSYEIKVKVCNGGKGGNGDVRPGGVPSLPYLGGFGGLGGGSSVGTPGSTTNKTNVKEDKEPEWVDKFESWVCDPCTNNFMDAAANCNGFDPKHPLQSIIKKIPIIGDVAGCGFDLKNCKGENEGRFWQKCGGSVLSCALTVCEKLGATLVGVGAGSASTGIGAAHGAAIAGAGKVMEAVCKWGAKGKEMYDCGKGLLTACPKKNGKKAPAAQDPSDTEPDSSYEGVYPGYLAQYLNKYERVLEGKKAIHDYYDEIVGYEEFNEATTAEMMNLFDAMEDVPEGTLLDADILMPYAPECIDEDLFRRFIDRQNNSWLRQQGLPYEGEAIDFDRLNEYLEIIDATNEYASSLGYESVAQMITDSYIEMQEGYLDKSGSVCSSVTLAIEQRMTMTRQAIRGTLTVVNGHESATLTDFKTFLTIYDEDGEMVGSDRLQIAVENLDGFTGETSLTSGWQLAHGSEGVARILFIPTRKAAPERETLYTFTGEVSYIDPFTGLEVTRPLTPNTLSIYPSPELYLTYFMQRDVMGDDPLTPNIIESSVPAEFALVIANKGKGDAANVSIATAQPRIVDNEKGLALEMRITESLLNGEPAHMVPDEKVVNDFGTIPASSTAYAQWMIESNLLGHFTDYDVDVTHVSSFDNPGLSLLDGAEIHELTQGMTLPAAADAPADAKPVRAFVVNDVTDSFDSPDRIYFSDGRADEAVFDSAEASIVVDGESGTLNVAPKLGGWQYISIPDPTYGMMELREIVRESDGAIIPTDNFRQTDRTLRDGHEPVYEYMLRGCVFADKGESYRLSFVEREDTPVKVVEWSGIPEEGTVAVTAVSEIGVRFSSQLDPATLNAENMKLLCQGQPVDISGIGISPADDAASFILDLGDLASANGYYQLSIDQSALRDIDGRRGTGWARCGWVMLADGKVHVKALAEPEFAGRVTISEEAVEPGTEVTLTATPAEGYQFSAWMKGDEILSRENTLGLTLEADTEVKALFVALNHQMNVTLSDPMAGTLTGAATGIYPHGTEVTLRSEAEPDWHFTGWILSAAGETRLLSAAAEYTLTVEADMDIIAQFEKDVPAVAASHAMHLRSGYNWVSFPISHDLYGDLPALLEPVKNEISAISADGAELRRENGEWSGDLNSISHLQGYRMLMNTPATLSLEGLTLTGSDLTMTLEEGMNLIGTPLRAATPVNEALAFLAVTEGDAILGHDLMAVFNGSEWVGSLTELQPGAAYMLNVAERSSFNWPAQSGRESATTAVADRTLGSLTVDPSDSRCSMGVVIRLESDEPIGNGEFAVAAFDAASGECIGISEEHDGLHFLVAHSDGAAGKQFIYKAVEVATGNLREITLSKPVAFTDDSVIGSAAQPILLNIGNQTGVDMISDHLSIYPNPVKDILNLTGIEDPEAELTIIDNEGRIHMRHNGLQQHTTLDLSDMAGGIYRLIIRIGASHAVKTIVKD